MYENFYMHFLLTLKTFRILFNFINSDFIYYDRESEFDKEKIDLV